MYCCHHLAHLISAQRLRRGRVRMYQELVLRLNSTNVPNPLLARYLLNRLEEPVREGTGQIRLGLHPPPSGQERG